MPHELPEAIRRSKALEPTLRAEGASALYRFGFTARSQAGPDSDIDILLETIPRKRVSLMDIARSTRLASEASHARVDLVSKQAIKRNILKELASAFRRQYRRGKYRSA